MSIGREATPLIPDEQSPLSYVPSRLCLPTCRKNGTKSFGEDSAGAHESCGTSTVKSGSENWFRLGKEGAWQSLVFYNPPAHFLDATLGGLKDQ